MDHFSRVRTPQCASMGGHIVRTWGGHALRVWGAYSAFCSHVFIVACLLSMLATACELSLAVRGIRITQCMLYSWCFIILNTTIEFPWGV